MTLPGIIATSVHEADIRLELEYPVLHVFVVRIVGYSMIEEQKRIILLLRALLGDVFDPIHSWWYKRHPLVS